MNNELHIAEKVVDHLETTLANAKAERDDLRTRRRENNNRDLHMAQRASAIGAYGFERGDSMFPSVAGIEAAA